MTRYAGDILDYMEIANLLIKRNGYFYLKGNELVALKTFADDNTWFNGYDSIYGKKVWLRQIFQRLSQHGLITSKIP